MIRNPILPGFNPDPSILRVGADYYIATSTFEWYPGVRLHHSRDLVTWTPIGGVLTDRHQVDLAGTWDSGGIWAPCLSYVDGTFHVVFTNVRSYTNGFWDTPNFVVTAPSIHGPWSAPVPLHSWGFDPSLFHDDDGRSWLLSNRTDWRPDQPWAGGIIAQEWSREQRTLVGDLVDIWGGTAAGMTEGPHVYRRSGWYYLLTAEGGTGWERQCTVARSRDLLGPYEPDPAGPLITSWPHPTLALPKAGHGSLVETPDGDWYLAHLVGAARHQPGGQAGPAHPGHVRVHGRVRPRRPGSDGRHRRLLQHPQLALPAPHRRGCRRPVLRPRCVVGVRRDRPGDRPARLSLHLDGAVLRFAVDEVTLPGRWDASILSDEYATELAGDAVAVWGFTGMFVGVWAQDLTGAGRYAEFSNPVYLAAG